MSARFFCLLSLLVTSCDGTNAKDSMTRTQDYYPGDGLRPQNVNRLLDNADTVIGNGVEVAPHGPTDGTATIRVPANPPRIIALDGLSQKGPTVTVGLSASTILPTNGASSQNPVPIVGIIEYGNGSVTNRIEVDIPVGRVQAIGGVLQATEDNVVLVCVPAGTLRVYGRNDSYLIVPDNGGLVGDVITPAGLAALTPPVRTGNANSALVKAFVTYGPLRGIGLPPTRTYYIGAITAAATITYGNDPATAYLIPPLARRFRVLRQGGNLVANMMAFTGSIYDAAGNILDNFSVAAGTSSPWFDLPGVAHRIGIAMVLTGAGATAEIEFEIQV